VPSWWRLILALMSLLLGWLVLALVGPP